MSSPIPVFVITLAGLCSLGISAQRVYAVDEAVTNGHLYSQVRQHRVINGDFEQIRELTGVPRPIRSSGRFVYWRDHGLYWEIREPVSQASTFTPDAVIHWQSTTGLQQSGSVTSPLQKQINGILLAFFGGDTSSLEKIFHSRWLPGNPSDAEHWTLELIPGMAVVKRSVKRITLSGDVHVKDLKIEASNGDKTRIRFSDIQVARHPSAGDCRYFDLHSASCAGVQSDTHQAEHDHED